MVDETRLIVPPDDFDSAFPGLGFKNLRELKLGDAGMLLIDPIYLADVYNEAEPIADYLRGHGAFIMDFGGDVNAEVWWLAPFLKLHVAGYFVGGHDPEKPADAEVLAESAFCDSGSFMFLPMNDDIPKEVQLVIEEALGKRLGCLLSVPSGRWAIYYEQFDAPQPNAVGLYRNIVVRRESD